MIEWISQTRHLIKRYNHLVFELKVLINDQQQ